MFLSRFRVRGYKCLEDVDIALTPIHVFIGPGDGGKSSLLEAISAFYGRLKTPATQWFPGTSKPQDLITHGSSVPAIDLAGQWSEMQPVGETPLPAAGYGYSILVPPSGTNLAISDQWVRPRAGKEPQSGLARVAIAFPQDRAAETAFRAVVKPMLEPAPVYSFEPRALAEPAQVDRSQEGAMSSNGYGFSLLLDDIAQRHPQRFALIRAEFCRILPRYQNIGLQTEAVVAKRKASRSRKPGSPEPTACGLYFETSSGRRVAARDVSPGAMLLLTMLMLARLPEPPPLLLIENIEQGLYPTWLEDVILPLKQAASRPDGRPFSQIILTTHSPAVLNFFEPAEVTLLSRPADKPDGPTIASRRDEG